MRQVEAVAVLLVVGRGRASRESDRVARWGDHGRLDKGIEGFRRKGVVEEREGRWRHGWGVRE